jgi:hypothetical protein
VICLRASQRFFAKTSNSKKFKNQKFLGCLKLVLAKKNCFFGAQQYYPRLEL